MSITYSGCEFVALGIQHEMRMRHIIIRGLHRTFHIIWQIHDFREEKITEHKMRVLIFSTTFVWDISHSKKKWARYYKKMYIGLQVKHTIFLFDFNENWNF
jgi:hypothetical protein